MTKYHAVKVKLDGYTFDSKKEAARYAELLLLVKAGHILELQVHPSFPLTVNGVNIGKYIADFAYHDWYKKKDVVEDVKGVKTPVYRLKNKLVKALYGIDILETT